MGTGIKTSVRAVLAGSLVLGGALTAVVIGGALPASAAAVVKTIPVGTTPDYISSDGTHVWVSNQGDGTVTELNASDGSVVRTITVCSSCSNLGISSDGTHVWVALDHGYPNTNYVEEVNASDGSLVRSTGVGTAGIEGVSSDGSHVWVANWGNGPGLEGSTVSELNTATGSVVQTITVGTSPYDVSSDGTHVWVTNSGDTSVTELNASDGSVVRTITVGSAPEGVSSDRTHVWVSNSNDDTVTELNASDGSMVQTIPVGMQPIGVSSDGTHVWVANEGDGTVSEIAIGSVPPTTSVLVPPKGATLSGSTTLDASASNATSVEFRLFGGVYGYSGPVLCAATLTYYGWVCSWNTTTVPNGSYTLLSEAFGAGGSAFSSGVNITVKNAPPPTTSVIIPSKGATLSGTAVALDASASNATSVEFWLLGGSYGFSGHLVSTAALTYYGWVYSWNTTTVPNGSYSLVSEAFGAGGSAFSSGVSITVHN